MKPWENDNLWPPGWSSVGEVREGFRSPDGLPLAFRRFGAEQRARLGDRQRRVFLHYGWAVPFFVLQAARSSRGLLTRIDGGVEETLRQLARIVNAYSLTRLRVVADAGPDAVWALVEAGVASEPT